MRERERERYLYVSFAGLTAHDEKKTWFTSELGTTEDSVFVDSDKNNIVRGQGIMYTIKHCKGLATALFICFMIAQNFLTRILRSLAISSTAWSFCISCCSLSFNTR